MCMSRALFPLSGLLMGGLLSATEISSVLPNYRELNKRHLCQVQCQQRTSMVHLGRVAQDESAVAVVQPPPPLLAPLPPQVRVYAPEVQEDSPAVFKIVAEFRPGDDEASRAEFAAKLRAPGVDVNATDAAGNSVWMLLNPLSPGWYVEELLAAGANPYVTLPGCDEGVTPFHYYLARHCHRLYEALLKAGYRLPQSQMARFRMLYDTAKAHEYGLAEDKLKLLQQYGVPLDTPNPDTGLTVLQTLIAEHAPWQFVENMLRAGASPNAHTQGEPPLLMALVVQDHLMVHALLKYGASVPSDELKNTLLFIAVRLADAELTERLLNMGASPTAVESPGSSITPLRIALLSGNEKLADLVMSAAQGECRFNNAFFELCRMAVEQNDVAFFANLPSSYLNADCGPLDSPFARMDGNPKATHYFAPVLLHAAAEGKADIVRVLLQRGADKEAEEYYGRTAIVYAAAKGHLACVQLLHRAGATKLDSALQAALLFKQSAVVTYLLEQGGAASCAGDACLQRSSTGKTELMLAVAQGRMNRVSYLLEHAPQLVNWQDSYGRTALMMARSAASVRLLLAYGADASIRNDLGLTALDEACQADRRFAVAALLEANAPYAQPAIALRYACSAGNAELARRILHGGGVDVNTHPESGPSLLALAVSAKSTELVDLLLLNGATIKGSGALRQALQTDQPQFVRLFMEHEHVCPPSPCSPRGGFSAQDKLNELLHEACRSNAPQSVKMLLALGANVNDTGMSSYGHAATGNAPLHAAACQSSQIVEMLLAAGADINARNADGDTPLMLAVRFRAGAPVSLPEEIALLLLERGADASLRNNRGLNAADLASYASHIQALSAAGVHKSSFVHPLAQAVFAEDTQRVAELLAAGENPDLPLPDGRTLLQVLADAWVDDSAVENTMFRLLVQGGACLQHEVFLRLCGWGNAVMMQTMLDAGFRVQPRGEATFQYLHAALHGNCPHKALPLLIQAGADINAENARGYTLLQEMAQSDYFIDRNLEQLLQHCPNLEIATQGSTPDWNGLTALSLAVRKGNTEMAYRLLLAGAKASPHEVQSIFFHVLREHPEQAAVLLSRFAASPSLPEPSTGLTPLDIASRSGNAQLFSLIQSALSL